MEIQDACGAYWPCTQDCVVRKDPREWKVQIFNVARCMHAPPNGLNRLATRPFAPKAGELSTAAAAAVLLLI